MKKLICMVGIPGSGKSYLAKKLAKKYNGIILSTDNFFMVGDEYNWSGEFIGDAHKWCQGLCALEMFKESECIIVDNTNLQAWQLNPYLDMAKRHGYEWELVQPKTKWASDPVECAKRNSHNVPESSIERMLKQSEDFNKMKKELQGKFKC